MVSAAITNPPGLAWSATASAFRAERISTIRAGERPGSTVSSASEEMTRNVSMPIWARSCFRRGEPEARMISM